MTPTQEKRISSLRCVYGKYLVVLGENGMGGVVVELKAKSGAYHVVEIGKLGHRNLLQINAYSRGPLGYHDVDEFYPKN